MAQFKGCLISGIKRGGGGNGRRMRCRARDSGSVAGEAGVTLEGGARPAEVPAVLPCFGAEGGRRGRLGRNLKRKPFRNKNWIFEFTKA
jgi:hypothetical protein